MPEYAGDFPEHGATCAMKAIPRDYPEHGATCAMKAIPRDYPEHDACLCDEGYTKRLP